MKKILIILSFFVSINASLSQWIEASRPAPAFPLFSFSFPSVNTGFAVGYGNAMIKSTNGGLNWFNVSIFSTTENNLNSVYFINDNTGWLCSTSDTVFYTTNSGASWSPQVHFISDPKKVYFVNSSTGWILSTPHLYKTTNGGLSWVNINSQMGYDFTFLNENTGWKTIYGGGSSTIYKTVNGGAAWTPQYSTSNFRVIYSIDFVNENTGWASGYREHILKTTNGGTTWNQQRDMDNGTGFYSMDFINENTGWAIGDNGLSVYTVNGGSTWNPVPLNAGRANVKFINSTTGWVVGSKVFRTTTGGLTYRTLNNTSLIEGFYDGSKNEMTVDTARVYLRNSSAPYQIKDSAATLLNSNGTGSFNFLNAVNGQNYFIIVKHRNSIETWSSASHSFNSNIISYDFSSSSSQAFGNNLKLKGNRWTIFSGDTDRDGFIDIDDLIITYNDANSFQTGYQITDVNGDDLTDLSDLVLILNNSVNFIHTIRP